ncbi:MAG: hypothetical protein ABIR92_01125 [Gemmatimonadaceae bacterium]
MTCLSNEVPVTETIPRTESLDAALFAGAVAFGGTSVVGTAGGPLTMIESLATAESTFGWAPLHAEATRQPIITLFFISISCSRNGRRTRH